MKSSLRFLKVFLLILPLNVLAQCPVPAPVIFCVDASVPGETTITYGQPPGTNFVPAPPQEGFDYYVLEHSLAPTGPFDSVNTDTDIGTTTLVHNTADHSVINYYKIISYSLCDDGMGGFVKQSLESNVFNTIVINSSVSNDTVISLSWNNNGLGNPGNGGYKLFRNPSLSGGGPLQLYNGNIPFATPNYGDTLLECNDKALYQVRINGPLGSNCESLSPVDTVDLVDNTPPSLQLVDSVSFNTFLNKPIIGWSPNDQRDIQSYVIVRCQPGGYTQLDTVSASKFSYIDTGYTNQGSVQYSVYALDLCGNASTDFGINCHNTMFLSYEIDICNETVELLWNAYDDYNSGVDVVYNIYVSQGGAPPQIIGSTKSTTFLHEDPITNTSLTYFVRAVENDGAGPFSAISNVVNLSTEFLRAPQYSYLRRVTVSDRNQVQLELYTDTDADVDEFRVKRASDTNLSSFITIGTLRLPSVLVPADSIVGYHDNTATTDISSYFYLFESLDSCGRVLDTSNFASSIRLRIEVDNPGRINKLTWNNYIGWEGEIFGYRVYRGQDGVFDPDPLVTVFPEPGLETTYEDDVNGLTNDSEGEFCYYIVAIEDEPTFPRLEPAKSTSNVVCVKHTPLMHIPNAFTPEGANPIFKPVIIFADMQEYSFRIFSRSGEIVYETTNISAGWDGTLEGNLMPGGVYVYLLEYKSNTGRKFEKRGIVNLIR